VISFIKIALKNRSAEIVTSNKKEIAIVLGISKESVGHIIGVLGF